MSGTVLRPPQFEIKEFASSDGTTWNRILVAESVAQSAQLGVLVLLPGEPTESSVPVRVVPVRGLPDSILVARANLLERCGVGAQSFSWELRLTGFRHIVAERMSLEVMVNQQLDHFADRVGQDASLDGKLLYLAAGESCGSLSLEAGGAPARVRELIPEASTDTVYEISAKTTGITLLAPTHRTGVDVVILADCSGSMAHEDLTVSGEAPPSSTSMWRAVFGSTAARVQYQSRSDALVQALLDLLDRRLLATGTVGRIALVAFGNVCELRFPRSSAQQGMVEVDETMAEDVRQQFRQAIKDLMPNRNWGTNIGQALQFAASHLSNFGKPGNERLIVIVSDGAHWKAKGDAGAGELLEDALEEPVSLMDLLHTRMAIRLHAIGISNPEIFERWVRSDPSRDVRRYLIEGSIPNHGLLEELVRVGGGDPARTGDASVLEDYMRGLGEGVTRRVKFDVRSSSSPESVSNEELKFVQSLASASGISRDSSPESVKELTESRDRLRERYLTCNKYSKTLSGGHSLFNPSPEASAALFDHSLVTPVGNGREFGVFQSNVCRVFDAGLADEIRIPDKAMLWPEPFPSIKQHLHSGNYWRLSVLGNAATSDPKAPARIRETADTMRFFIGVPLIDETDSPQWLALQVKIIEFLVATLSDIEGLLRQSVENERNTATPGAPDTVIQW